MITKKDAIAIGKAICNAVVKEQENNTSKTVAGTDYRDEKGSNRVYGARGAGLYAMDNLWYDVLPNNVKESFTDANGACYSREAFYKACGWPE